MTNTLSSEVTKKFKETFFEYNKFNNLSFLSSLEDQFYWKEVEDYFSEYQISKYKTMYVVGMGGSSLGAKVITQYQNQNNKQVVFVDTVDPTIMQNLVENVNLEESCFLFNSKSGNTIEVLSLFNFLYHHFGRNILKQLIIIVSDENSELAQLSRSNNLQILKIPNDIGGRFSFLTQGSLLIYKFIGLSLSEANNAAKNWGQSIDKLIEMGLEILSAYYDKHRILPIWCYGEKVYHLGLWIQQLLSESLAKQQKQAGQLPVPIVLKGPQDQHSLLQQFSLQSKEYHLFLLEKNHTISSERWENQFLHSDFLNQQSLVSVFEAECFATVAELNSLGKQTYLKSLDLNHNSEIISFMVGFMVLIVSIGDTIGVSPYGQPGVESGKKKIKQLLNEGLIV